MNHTKIGKRFLVIRIFGDKLIPYGSFTTRQNAFKEAEKHSQEFPTCSFFVIPATLVESRRVPHEVVSISGAVAGKPGISTESAHHHEKHDRVAKG